MNCRLRLKVPGFGRLQIIKSITVVINSGGVSCLTHLFFFIPLSQSSFFLGRPPNFVSLV